MKDIKECAVKYSELVGKNYVFELENDLIIKLPFKAENFYHLLGLHYLTDIDELDKTKNSAIIVYKKILSDDISGKVIGNSVYYPKISDRVQHFDQLFNMLNEGNCEVVVDFDSKLVKNTKLRNTKYILYIKEKRGISHFCIAIGKNSKGYYPETFFFESSNKYLTGQALLTVKKISCAPQKSKKK